jgi:peptidoglycan-associated lipoprotein
MFKKILILIAALAITACHCNYNMCKHNSCKHNSGKVANQFENKDQDYREVFFAFNASNVDSEAKKMLDLQVAWLKKNSEIKVMIEGHCDARGGEKYNVVLGEKRALAVKKYLVDHGIDAKRLKTISYGKDHPSVAGSNEEAWAKNRRSVTIVKQ